MIFISWIIFSRVGLEKKIPSSQFKCLQYKTKTWKSLHMSQVAIRPALISSFSSMKQLEYFHSSLDGVLVHHRANAALNVPVPIYTTEWREALWEKGVLPKNTTQWPCPGFKHRPFDFWVSALTVRPLYLHTHNTVLWVNVPFFLKFVTLHVSHTHAGHVKGKLLDNCSTYHLL